MRPVWTTQGPQWVPEEWARALTSRRQDVPLSSAVRAALDARAFLWVPQKGVVQVIHNVGTVGANPLGTSMTTGGAAATKGTAVECISAASNTMDTYYMVVQATQYGLAATDAQGAMDILIGGATDEVLIANLLMGFCSPTDSATGVGPKRWEFPIYIPSGLRIAAQAAGQRISTAVRAQIFLYGGDAMPGFRVGRKATTYGMGTVPFGTTVTPGASGAEGTWTAITTSTSEDHFCFVPSYQCGTDTTLTRSYLAVDLGVAATADAATTATEMAQSFMFAVTDNEMMRGPENSHPAYFDVPSGSQLTMRSSCSTAIDAGNYNGVIHAVS